MRVEDIWDSLDQPQLSRSDKLNSCFDAIPVSSFPQTFGSQLVDIPSDATLAEAVDILSRNRINGAPVRNVEAPEDASWIDRYIGIVEFAGIAVWLLHQSETSAAALGADEMAAKLGTVTLDPELKPAAPASEAEGAVAEAFGSLPSSELFRKTKVKDISGSFRWAPFLALQSSDTFLTMLLLLSKYRMKSLPVVDIGEGTISNMVTQAAVVHMLAECVGLSWTLTAREFIASARQCSGEKQMSIITCTREDNMKEIILKLDAEKRQRIYVVDGEGNLDGLITLRDIIAKLVYEPPGYFGDFFNGVIPMPQNSRV
ncbi:SNF1-related protein kinase regulatory subunit gamma 1 [Triticum urartu]|uniref:SNF1-related protein kinase regulatory subunit gamma 1 n=1 Tax=Triticum urartu TaxID=4572 RepID=M7ZZA9_TRIUA|nr:SNF1-related protein kinase regulatory subunit gamma 1 [Triticum urartu]